MKQLPAKPCEYCGIMFTPSRASAKYHRASCATAAKRKRDALLTPELTPDELYRQVLADSLEAERTAACAVERAVTLRSTVARLREWAFPLTIPPADSAPEK